MTAPSRESIAGALFELLQTATDFVTTGRRVKLWTEIGEAQLPALYLMTPRERHVTDNLYTPTKLVLAYNALVYVSSQDQEKLGDTLLNNLIDAIDPRCGGVLKPDNPLANTQTLGGLVQHCWIEGDIERAPGDLDGVAIALIPINVLVP